ncbi:methylenetetrahydrofolate--tRNA-(uracil(54)-C(5))-methyltransferase (FADH(2)-oxidizing) TrmFO [Carboxydochorda subterranea]|uniref:Methylenetetrahydrofolate--tRNA-(uracil-5-)-methyltransferase TrmFO n=1 Tax=Carboxydichorda subterranea TaxID=3109565 RepID=A0ABZ1C114_9FIRM|nr:methylenetetrahydrofolate--tRNA-(uracil(54)-C(5))-methyltransferase (FADH(2)-oxidizing) TrmFO [Limnochorda sp. L945t]WRP18441.1 methylenetetrahydrofolate--tRNA-(uracil(54)-C(5))-methyltransferase (FADH(2)-oxidizing) TrmFO [Limnochorda sp. L945t]
MSEGVLQDGPVVTVVGGGLAGSEAAWQAARMGARVRLYEMRPARPTPVHQTGLLAELVCSNSLGGAGTDTSAGLLKEEMRRLGSLVVQAADAHRVPAGSALAVDRERFASEITRKVEAHPSITVIREEVREVPEPGDGVVVLATGPLTSDALAASLARLVGDRFLAFYDAAAPIVTAESIDTDRGFWASRHGKGTPDYLNLPMDREQYEALSQALAEADVHEGHLPEELKFFEGCVPVEELARRGLDTLRYGPMRPVGLRDPRTGQMPYAVVQLRKEDAEGRLLNLVGFQTRLKWGEQARIFRMIPGLEQAEFVRFGVVHRNTFVNAPRVLEPTGQVKGHGRLLLAGLITGVEGYVESAAAGWLAGVNAARILRGLSPMVLPPETMMGALWRYVTTARPDDFQPMNAAFGLLPPAGRARSRQERRARQAERALQAVDRVAEEVERWVAELGAVAP